MYDYASLSDRALIELQDQLKADHDTANADDQRCSRVETELSRRAGALCGSVDNSATRICQLENWSVRVSRDPRDRGAVVLAGHASGHRDYPNGTPIVTGPLEMIVRTTDEDLAMTLNSLYVEHCLPGHDRGTAGFGVTGVFPSTRKK